MLIIFLVIWILFCIDLSVSVVYQKPMLANRIIHKISDKVRGVNQKAIPYGFDDEGYPTKYDAHYARKIEIEQGLQGQLTKCDNDKCTECNWKAHSIEFERHLPSMGLQQMFSKWVNELPDGLSDELYDSMRADWAESVSKEIDFQNKQTEKIEKRKNEQKSEAYYGTPIDKVWELRAKGYTFSKINNSWYPPAKYCLEDELPDIPIYPRLLKGDEDIAYFNESIDQLKRLGLSREI